MNLLKRCSCGRCYDAQTWQGLEFVGYQAKGFERTSVFEMRQCACGSSLVAEICYGAARGFAPKEPHG